MITLTERRRRSARRAVRAAAPSVLIDGAADGRGQGGRIAGAEVVPGTEGGAGEEGLVRVLHGRSRSLPQALWLKLSHAQIAIKSQYPPEAAGRVVEIVFPLAM